MVLLHGKPCTVIRWRCYNYWRIAVGMSRLLRRKVISSYRVYLFYDYLVVETLLSSHSYAIENETVLRWLLDRDADPNLGTPVWTNSINGTRSGEMLRLFSGCFDKKAESKRLVFRAYLGISFSVKQMVHSGLDPPRASCPRSSFN
jgi:hypothetical protein